MQCDGTGDCPQAMVQRVLNGKRLALCLRSRGVPNWPDSTVDSEGRPGFNLLPMQGFNPNSPRIDDTLQECEHVTPKERRTGSIDPPGQAQLNSGIPAARGCELPSVMPEGCGP